MMKKFEDLKDLPVAEREESVAQHWDSIDLLDKSVAARLKAKPFVFL